MGRARSPWAWRPPSPCSSRAASSWGWAPPSPSSARSRSRPRGFRRSQFATLVRGDGHGGRAGRARRDPPARRARRRGRVARRLPDPGRSDPRAGARSARSLVRDHPAGSAAATAPAPSLAGMRRRHDPGAGQPPHVAAVPLRSSSSTPPWATSCCGACRSCATSTGSPPPRPRCTPRLPVARAARRPARSPAISPTASCSRRKLPYTVLAAGRSLVWLAFVATLGTLPLVGRLALLFAHGHGGRGLRADLAARARGQPAARSSGIAVAVDQPGRLPGRRAHPGAGRRRARRAAGRAPWRRARASIRWRHTAGAFAICALFVLVGGRDQPPAAGDAGREHPSPAASGPSLRGNRAP